MKYEHQYLIFDVSDGPKVITESLNTYGKEGWEVKTMINVGGDKLCAWMAKGTPASAPDPKAAEQKKIDKLWSDDKK
tara:strand:+ start:957 stop:1187 length:231 start_codon:yes stop_codon:yes gene_type:complete